MNPNVQMHGLMGRNIFVAAGLLVGMVLFSGTLAAQDDDAKEFRLLQSASAAMEEEAWDDAIAFWGDFIEKHSDSQRLHKAWYGLAKCHYLKADYAKAIPAFEKAVPLLSTDDVKSLDVPEALLLLGFSRLQHGRDLGKAASPDALLDPEKLPRDASIQLTTATQNFEAILKNYEKFENANQAAHFQGLAYSDLGRLDEAKASFEKALGYDDKSYQLDSLFSLGTLTDRQRKFSDSANWYQQLIDASGTEPNKFLTETKYRYGEALMRLGQEARDNDDADGFREKFTKAKDLLQQAGTDEGFPLRDKVLYQNAFCSLILGETETAAEGFQTVAALENSTLAAQAKVRAGEAWLSTGKADRGRKLLDEVMQEGGSWSIDAAHAASRNLIENEKPKQALELAEKWVGKAKGHPREILLLMDQADATAAIEDVESESAELYADIADRFKSNALAPKALYWSAFGNVKYGKPEEAIRQADKFEKLYDGDDFTSDMLEVKAEALLLTERFSEAESGFRKLVNDYSGQEKKLPYWITRAGFASYLQENYDQTIEWLGKNEGKITDPLRKAESLYWIGSSHYRKGEYSDAVKNLEQSLTANNEWNRAPEVMLALCNGYVQTAESKKAKEVADELKQRFGNNPGQMVSRAFYVLGEHEKANQSWDKAIDAFDVVAKDYDGCDLAENAAYQAAFCSMEKGDAADAESRFTAFAKKWPGSDFAADAKLAAGNAMRSSGNTEGAIERLKQLVEEAKNPATKNKASMQLGLGYVDQEMWDEAIEVFDGLTQTDGESESADSYWYELAWAQRSKGDKEASLKSFASLVEKFPGSESAPESHFFLASKAYGDKEYDAAIDHYEKADVDSARDEIREKARYKLAWSHFRKEDFGAASKAFQKQVDGYPNGILHADGLYMIGQSAYREEKFADALEAFAKARPAVEKSEAVSERIKLNTLLFGARSANKVKRYQPAADMAKTLSEHPGADASTVHQAMLELGMAQTGLGETEQALESLNTASESDQVTGAKAMALLGDAWFAKAVQAAKDGDESASRDSFNEAIDVYRSLYFGWRNSDSAEIKSWQAYAAYESGRCNMVQIKTAEDARKPALISEAKRHFESLVKKFPNDKLASEASKQLATLEKLEQ